MAEANGNATSRSTQNASPASASRQLLKLNPSSKMFFGKKKNSVLHLLFTGNCIKMDLFVKKSDGEGCDIKSVSISYRDLSAFRYYIADSQVKSQFSLFALEPKFEPYKRLSQWSNQTMGVVVPENFLMMQFKSLSISQMEVIFRLVKASLGELKAANILIPLSNSYAKAYLLTPNRASGRTNGAISTESSNKVTFFDSEELSDFKVIVDGKSINVHKYVLASRSPVFRVMLGHTDTVEARENKVDIPDIPHDIMKVFLEFLYTGVKPEDDQLSLDLLVVADKVFAFDLTLHLILTIVCFLFVFSIK